MTHDQRFEEGLENIAASLRKKSGVKQEEKVFERVGRLKGKYPSIHRYYDISYEIETTSVKKRKTKETREQRTVTSLMWKIKENPEMNERSGIYFLRTSLQEPEQILWDACNTIRQVESTIRCLKTDLDLRPVYHKKDDTSLAHLHLGLIVCQLVSTIRYQLKLKPVPETKEQRQEDDQEDDVIRYDWSETVRVMNTQKAVTTIAQNNKDEVIIIRTCSEPSQKAKQIYQKLAYRYYPFKKKKFVVHKTFFENPECIDNEQLDST